MQTPLISLWLPIIVSGIALFFASFAAWMLLPHHKPEWKGVDKEDSLLEAMRSASIGPGQYMFPYARKPEDWKSEEFKRRQETGPTGTLIIWNRRPNMAVNMACTVLFFTVVSAVIAYLAGIALPPGADFLTVFRLVGTAGILTYGSANILNGIWFGRKMMADIVDGIVYGLITGLIFAALWPGGPSGA